MRKTLTALSIVLVLLAAGCGDDGDDDGTVASDSSDSTASTAGGSSQEVEGRPVEIVASGFAFEPDQIDAEPGEVLAITLKNEDGTDHTFTSSDPEVGKTVAGGAEASFSVTVPESGSMEWHCAIHPQMTGTIGGEGGSASSVAVTSDDGY
jgi:plastocyanin